MNPNNSNPHLSTHIINPNMVPPLHIFFFPFLAKGHMLPMLDMAKMFCSRGVKSTIITTHSHVPMFEAAIEKCRPLGLDMSVRAIKFPTVESGLPEGTEDLNGVKSDQLIPVFFMATLKLRDQLEQLLEEFRPDCLIADMFFPWATDAAAKFSIPRISFHGTNTFSMCVGESLDRNRPFDAVSSNLESFIVPELPHEIKMTPSQIPVFQRIKFEVETEWSKLLQQIKDVDTNCYGVIINSFHELEPDYADHYTNKLGRKNWHVGPFLLCKCNKEVEDHESHRGAKSAIDGDACVKWLDSKTPNSVVYVCFGSLSSFTRAQLHEIAKGLEISGQDFIWAVRGCVDEEDSRKWFPEGFEERIGDKGLIIKGWAPQLLILGRESVGAFVTHCGWNSTLEGLCSGVPLVTWPMFAEQFVNERLVTDVLRVGVGVGATRWGLVDMDVVEGEKIGAAVERVMAGEEAMEMRARSKKLKEMAECAVEEGGSSYDAFTALIQDLSVYHSTH